ncbi:hypothetical protein [Caldovatus aquaticus]|uniref:Uncharacterized protein n=1 Tax=Caldovatus aquaticus TaxID=2865671 RepID=A0ABS7F1L1_9PROT|nr:hypothetical protein [Caldovatus aquaticus]MBW8269517.1 hypothetical protein [Caldovatus aquaticus]
MGSEGDGGTAPRPVTVTLAMAHGPGFPEGSPEHRYELRVVLDRRGCLNAEAWFADPEPWPVRRLWPGEPERRGDVQYDPDSGWFLRLFAGGRRGEGGGSGAAQGAPSDAPAPTQEATAADLSDAPVQHMFHSPGPLRPGEYVSITEPDGREYSYRIVAVG